MDLPQLSGAVEIKKALFYRLLTGSHSKRTKKRGHLTKIRLETGRRLLYHVDTLRVKGLV